MCELDMRLVSETVAPTAVTAVPPVNALRNLALGIVDAEVPIRVGPKSPSMLHAAACCTALHGSSLLAKSMGDANNLTHDVCSWKFALQVQVGYEFSLTCSR